jgi:hypothetical protein
MSQLTQRPQLTRTVSGIETTPEMPVGLPFSMRDVPPSGPEFMIPGQVRPFDRQVTTQGANPILAAIADFATSFGFGPQAGAAQIERRIAAQERPFEMAQREADRETQRTLQTTALRRQQLQEQREQDLFGLKKIESELAIEREKRLNAQNRFKIERFGKNKIMITDNDLLEQVFAGKKKLEEATRVIDPTALGDDPRAISNEIDNLLTQFKIDPKTVEPMDRAQLEIAALKALQDGDPAPLQSAVGAVAGRIASEKRADERAARQEAAADKREQERLAREQRDIERPTVTTKTMAEAAPKVINFVNRIRPLVQKEASGLGPLAGRWSNFWAGTVGSPDPTYTELKTNIGLLSTLLMRMHVGARGGEKIMEHFKAMIDSGRQSPENLLASLKAIEDYANDIKMKPKEEGKRINSKDRLGIFE